MRRRTWAAGMVMAAAVAVSTAPVATAESLPIHRAVFPVTMTRTGGIAGFQDVLVVAADGRASLTRRGQLVRQCHLKLAVVQRLRTAVSRVPWARITPASGRPSFPDDMVVLLRSPAGGPARIEDSRVGAAGKVFQELLTELTVVRGGPAASRMCKAA